MSWNFLLWFLVGFGIYLVGLVIWSIIKKHKIKKQVENEDKNEGEKIDENDKK